MFFEASGERIDFKLREKQRQVRKPKTPDEIKRLLPGEKTWRQELQPTGVLTFSIETYLPALQRRAWTETADQPLEEQATRWRQADEVRRFLEVLTQHADVAASLTNGESVSEWLSWARTRLAAFDPLAAGATGVFEDLLKITAWTYRQ